MSGPTVIDLGVCSPSGTAEPPPDRPWLTRARLARWRRRAMVALAAVLVASLAGAVPAPAPPLARLWTVPGGPYTGSDVAVGERDLYAVASTGDGYALTAYRLADGAVRWSVPLAVPDDSFEVTVIDGIPVVYSFERVGRTSAYDPDTAQLRWTSQGLPDYVGGGMVGLTALPVPGADGELAGAVPTLELREVSSGAVAVSFDGRTQQSGYGETSDGQVLAFGLDRDGRLSRYDVATGALVGTVATEFAARPGAGFRGSVSVADGLVMLSGEIGVDDGVVAYDATTLERLWEAPGGHWAESCGPMVCLAGLDQPLRGLAPGTGALQWTMTCADAGVSGECQLRTRELGPDRLIVYPLPLESDRADPVRQLLVDATTGRPVTSPTVWDIGIRSGSRLVLMREETEHRIWWARSDLDLGRVEVLGVIEADWCTPHPAYLLCYGADGAAEVWRIA